MRIFSIRGNNPSYWLTDPLTDEDPLKSASRKDLPTVKKEAVARFNAMAHAAMQPTDWMIAREIEGGDPMTEEWKDWRASIRSAANIATYEANNAESIKEVDSVSLVIPPDPDHQGPEPPQF